jgi:hypothetical protein
MACRGPCIGSHDDEFFVVGFRCVILLAMKNEESGARFMRPAFCSEATDPSRKT